MSAIIKLAPKGTPSIEALTAERDAIDAEIVDVQAALAEGTASDEDLASLRAKRAKIEDRLAGARTLAAREQKRRADDERADDERALTEAAAVIAGVREHMDQIAERAAARFLDAFEDAEAVRQLVQKGDAAERNAKRLAEKLKRKSAVSAPSEGLFVGSARSAIEQAKRTRDRSIGDLAEDLLTMRMRP